MWVVTPVPALPAKADPRRAGLRPEISQRTVERYVAGKLKRPRQDLRGRLEREVKKRWQSQIRPKAGSRCIQGWAGRLHPCPLRVGRRRRHHRRRPRTGHHPSPDARVHRQAVHRAGAGQDREPAPADPRHWSCRGSGTCATGEARLRIPLSYLTPCSPSEPGGPVAAAQSSGCATGSSRNCCSWVLSYRVVADFIRT